MKFPVYAVRDEKASQFNNIMLSSNDYVMERAFANSIVNGYDAVMKFSPRDFVLYKIGEFDADKGTLIPLVPVVRLIDGAEVVNNYVPSEKE